MVGSQIGLTNQVQFISSQEQALEFISNPMTPCVLRVQVIQHLPAEVSVPATLQAVDLDRRCPPRITKP